MNKKLLEELKEKLEKEKSAAEEQLKTFASKDQKLEGDWDTKYPHFSSGAGSGKMEEAADEVEEYEAHLPIEFGLETKLKDTNAALQKIKKGAYGKCEECGKKISLQRMKICPEAKFCLKCGK